MAKEVVVKLFDPVIGHKGPITALTLREPKAGEVFRLGELQIVNRTASGDLIYMDRDEIYLKYADILVDDDARLNEVVERLSLADAYQLKEAINGFFQAAQARAYAPSPSFSSSNSDGSAQANS